jgi:hypothetical protein
MTGFYALFFSISAIIITRGTDDMVYMDEDYDFGNGDDVIGGH